MNTPTPTGLGRVARGSGPGLLLAHGATGSIDGNYGPLLDGLAARHTVVGPDYPGSGRTPRTTEELDLDRLVDDLVATAVEEGLETFAVLGYSLGGALAIRAATRHPERVTALVVTAGFAHAGPRMRLLVEDWLAQLTSGDTERSARWAALHGPGTPFLDGLDEAGLAALVEACRAPAPPGAIDQLGLVDSLDVRPDLGRITVPTLVISTAHDLLVTPHHHREVAAGITGAGFAELPSGHLPFVEAPEAWLALVTGFLARAHAG
ncbi:alpha/beta hydrolase [Streptomyces sp. 8K308]|uniref:alpha/beta fold hydrolase n=1 Tax=Streptomyces sp. 8K308 TaxID=2530388 RepID=UPI00104F0C3F|nr:alpha/beta hydrolase [Streptomyces sp. 8K308]TDC23371.1 alpha/beta hydrolase [Streptomyces sp. 8K308]